MFTQTIYLQGDHIQNVADMYLQIETPDGMEMLDGIHLKIYVKDELISECPLNGTQKNQEKIFLHQFTKSEFVELKVVLEVPISIGNEISDLHKELYTTFIGKKMELKYHQKQEMKNFL